MTAEQKLIKFKRIQETCSSYNITLSSIHVKYAIRKIGHDKAIGEMMPLLITIHWRCNFKVLFVNVEGTSKRVFMRSITTHHKWKTVEIVDFTSWKITPKKAKTASCTVFNQELSSPIFWRKEENYAGLMDQFNVELLTNNSTKTNLFMYRYAMTCSHTHPIFQIWAHAISFCFPTWTNGSTQNDFRREDSRTGNRGLFGFWIVYSRRPQMWPPKTPISRVIMCT